MGLHWIGIVILLGATHVIHANPVNTRDSLALVALYQATGGSSSWKTKWDLDLPMHTWYGVETNLNGDVVLLDLSKNGLTGSLPDDLGRLIQLRTLRLQFNALTGGLPESMKVLINLQELTAFSNRLDQPLSDSLTRMTHLRMLGLSNNLIPGSIPEGIGGMDSLRMLLLDQNQLTGTIPGSMGQLSKLEVLSLYQNQLSGDLPKEMKDLVRLKECILYNNKLDGTLPAELAEMDSLRYFWVYNNALHGAIPSFRQPSLLSIRLENNRFSDLPDLTGLNLGAGFPEGLSVQYNQLSFDDIIINAGLSSQSRFSYRPQDTLEVGIEVYANQGDRLQIILPFDDTVGSSSYRWFKEGNLNQLTYDNVMVINNVQKSDEGLYYVEVRNSIIQDIILVTTSYHVIVRDSAQCDDPPAGENCFSAPEFCSTADLDLYCGTLKPAFDTLVCRDIGLSQETSWLGWVADSSYMELEVLPFSCSGVDAGVQWELYRGCSGRSLIRCQDSCSNAPSSVIFDDLERGAIYFLAIRACGGQCKYQLRSVSGGRPLELEVNGPLVAPDTLCRIGESTDIYLLNAPSSADHYQWMIGGDTFLSQEPSYTYVTTSEGSTELCVRAFSNCDTSNWLCRPLQIIQGPEIVGLTTTVVRNDSFYIVEFQTEGGRGTIVIDGLAGKYNAVSKIFTSDLISCGTPFAVSVEDATGCRVDTTGVEVCQCSSDAGRLPDILIEGCTDERIRVGPPSLVFRDSNDISGYVLIGGQSYTSGAILQYSTTGFFEYDSGVMSPDRVYYGFHVVGNGVGGMVDLKDPCLDVSKPQPLIFYTLPIANAGMDAQYCQKTFLLRARKSRVNSQGSWVQILGPTGVTIAEADKEVTSVEVIETGDYIFEWTEEYKGCGTSDTVIIRILPEIQADILAPDSMCNGDIVTLAMDQRFDTYLWSTGDTTATTVINEPGQYCCLVTKDSLCAKNVCVLIKDAIDNYPNIMGNTLLCEGQTTMLQVIPQYDTYAWDTGDSTFFISVDTPGTYCITVTDYKGCRAKDCIVIIKDKSRTTYIVDTLCHTETVTVFDSVLSRSGHYELFLDDGQHCDSMVVLDLLVFPEIYIGDSLVVRDDGSGNGSISVNIKGGRPPYDYLWNTGATIPFVSGLKSGVYTLTVTDANECEGVFVFDLREPNGLNDFAELPWHVYPNPVYGDQLLLMGDGWVPGMWISFEWSTLTGGVIQSGDWKMPQAGTLKTLPMPVLPSGVYLLKLSSPFLPSTFTTLRVVKR